MPQDNIQIDTNTCCRVCVEFGRTTMPAEQVDQLKAGQIVPLEAFADDYVELWADGRPVARGRLVVVEGKIAVRVQESFVA